MQQLAKLFSLFVKDPRSTRRPAPQENTHKWLSQAAGSQGRSMHTGLETRRAGITELQQLPSDQKTTLKLEPPYKVGERRLEGTQDVDGGMQIPVLPG
ncbi:hypothetical protein LEMLEM_LOCUS6981, partial [Lemmus lemmus]